MDEIYYIEIEVPDLNDSVSRIVLDSKVYNIRFTYNDTFDYWKLSLYTDLMDPIFVGTKIVPNFPMDRSTVTRNVPKGFFMALSRDETIGRRGFLDGKAQFCYVPIAQ